MPTPLPACSTTYAKLDTYQACEHNLPYYIQWLQNFKISLPSSVQRDFVC